MQPSPSKLPDFGGKNPATQASPDAVKDTQQTEIDKHGQDIRLLNKKAEPIDIVRVKADYRVKPKDRTIIVDCSPGAVIITLPKVATMENRSLEIKKIDSSANALTVESFYPQTIDGGASVSTTTQNDVYRIKADKKCSCWWVL